MLFNGSPPKLPVMSKSESPVKRAFGLAVKAAGRLAGSWTLRKDGRPAPNALGVHALLWAAHAFVLVSALGLLIGNVPRAMRWPPALVLQAALLAAAAALPIVLLFREARAIKKKLGATESRARLAAAPLAVGALASAAGVVAGFAGAFAFWDILGSQELGRAKAEVVAAGYSVELPANSAQPPESENRVPAILKAAEEPALKDWDRNNELGKLLERLGAGEQPAAKDRALLKKELAALKPALALLRRGLARPKTHWGIKWEHPAYKISIPRYLEIVKLGKALAAQGALAASEGRAAESIDSIRQGLLLADTAASTEFMISVMVGHNIAVQNINAARYALNFVPHAPAAKAWLPLLDDEAALKRLHGSVALELFAMQGWIESTSWRQLPWHKLLPFLPAPADGVQLVDGVDEFGTLLIWPFLKFDLASSYRGSLLSMKAYGLPWAEALAGIESADRWVEKNGWFLAQLSRPSLLGVYKRGRVNATHIRLARAAIASKGYRAKFKRWPGATDRLGVSLEDPFTGSSFAFKTGPAGLLIYSPGPDLKDEQGAPFERGAMTGDIAWRVSAKP